MPLQMCRTHVIAIANRMSETNTELAISEPASLRLDTRLARQRNDGQFRQDAPKKAGPGARRPNRVCPISPRHAKVTRN